MLTGTQKHTVTFACVSYHYMYMYTWLHTLVKKCVSTVYLGRKISFHGAFVTCTPSCPNIRDPAGITQGGWPTLLHCTSQHVTRNVIVRWPILCCVKGAFELTKSLKADPRLATSLWISHLPWVKVRRALKSHARAATIDLGVARVSKEERLM